MNIKDVFDSPFLARQFGELLSKVTSNNEVNVLNAIQENIRTPYPKHELQCNKLRFSTLHILDKFYWWRICQNLILRRNKLDHRSFGISCLICLICYAFFRRTFVLKKEKTVSVNDRTNGTAQQQSARKNGRLSHTYICMYTDISKFIPSLRTYLNIIEKLEKIFLSTQFPARRSSAYNLQLVILFNWKLQ